MSPLIEAVFRDDPAELNALLRAGSDPNLPDEDGRTPLMHAAIDNKLLAVRLLIGAGADAKLHDRVGNTALHYAAQEYHCEVASLLLNNGAEIDAVDRYGNTALWRAVFNSQGRGEMIAILLNSGANRNSRNHNGKSPQDLAATIANYDVRKFFIAPDA